MSAGLPPPPERFTLPVNGIELYYEVHGEGSPLVLLHWYTGTGQIWEPFIAEFAQEYRLIVPDLRGHGHSTNPTRHFTHRQAAADIFALLDHLQIPHYKAIGMSSGAEVLLHMATQQPTRVEAMVLLGTEIYYSPQARAMYRDLTDDSEVWDWQQLRQQHIHGDEQIRALLDQFQEFAHNYDDMHFTPPHLATIGAQTLNSFDNIQMHALLRQIRENIMPKSRQKRKYQYLLDKITKSDPPTDIDAPIVVVYITGHSLAVETKAQYPNIEWVELSQFADKLNVTKHPELWKHVRKLLTFTPLP